MLIFLPILFLIILAATLYLFKVFRPDFRYTWLLTAGALLAVWLFYLFTPLISFKTVEIPQWLPFSTVVMPINFKLAQASWQISFLITGLMLGGIFSAIIDENHFTAPQGWSATIFVASLGLLSLAAGDPVSYVLTLMALDTTILIDQVRSNPEKAAIQKSVWQFGAKVLGSLLIIYILGLTKSATTTNAGFIINVESDRIWILVAILLRSSIGFSPDSTTEESGKFNYQEEIQHLISATASLALLTRIVDMTSQGNTAPWFSLLFFVFGLLNVYRLIVFPDPIKNPSRITGIVFSISGYSLLAGKSSTINFWLCLFVFCAGFLLLFRRRTKALIWLPIIALIVGAGLPFTPYNPAWSIFQAARCILYFSPSYGAVYFQVYFNLQHPGKVMSRWSRIG